MSSIMDQLLEMGFSSLKAIVDHENDYDDENAQESSEEVKLLTDEEKKQQMEKLKELLKLKQSQRDEQKRQAEICQEKQRRTQGKYMGSAKAKFDEDEIRRMLEQKKREKDEDKAYREKLKADIAREREEKRIRRLDEVDIPKSSPIPPMVSFAKSDNTTCRLQIRFPSGILVKSEFKAEDLLEKVMLYVTENWPDSLGLIQSNQIQVFTNFPKREFLETDLNVSLFDLGLCPSAVLFARELPSTV